MSRLGISVYLSDRVKRREYDGRCKENLPGSQAYFTFYGYYAFYAHGGRKEIEGLLDDQKRKVTGKSTQIYHQTIKFIPLSPKISLTTQMLK